MTTIELIEFVYCGTCCTQQDMVLVDGKYVCQVCGKEMVKAG